VVPVPLPPHRRALFPPSNAFGSLPIATVDSVVTGNGVCRESAPSKNAPQAAAISPSSPPPETLMAAEPQEEKPQTPSERCATAVSNTYEDDATNDDDDDDDSSSSSPSASCESGVGLNDLNDTLGSTSSKKS